MVTSVILNITLIIILIIVNKKEKRRQEIREKLEMMTRELLNEQIKILSNNDYTMMNMEIEIAKYIKDVVMKSITVGNFTEVDKKRLHRDVLKRYPDLFSMFIISGKK